MAEPDAFGREKGEDPLAEMGWSESPAAPAEVERADAAAPGALGEATTGPGAIGEAVPGRPSSRRRRRPSVRRGSALGCLPTLLFFGAVIAVIAAIGVPIVSEVSDSLDDIDTPRIEGPPGSGPGEQDGAGAPPRNLQRRSMLVRRNLAPALRDLRGKMGGRLHYVRIEAARVDLQVARRGRLVSAQARWDREPEVFQPITSPASTTFAWSRVDPSAPARFVRAALRQAGRPRAAFGYAVLVEAAGLRWQVFLDDGTHFTASLDGRRVERV